MNIEEAKEIMNNFIKDTPKMPYECLMNKEVDAVETVLNELERYKQLINNKNARLSEYAEDVAKRDKVIDEMAKEILDIDEIGMEKCNGCINDTGIYKSDNEECIDCIKRIYL